MGTWTAAADALLTAAEGAQVPPALPPDDTPLVALSSTVDRTFVAPGPDYATDCALLAVHLDRILPLPVALDSDLGPQFGCIIVPTVRLVLRYRGKCVPVPGPGGKPPPAEDVEAWSTLSMERSMLLWQAIADAVLGGALDVGGCHDASMGEADAYGPSGGMAGITIPVTVRLQS